MSLPMTPLVGTGPRLGAARAARVVFRDRREVGLIEVKA